MPNDEEEDKSTYKVVVNHEEQYSRNPALIRCKIRHQEVFSTARDPKSHCGGRKDAELYGTSHHLLSQAKRLE